MKELLREVKNASFYTSVVGLFLGACIAAVDVILIYPYLLGVMIGLLIKSYHDGSKKG